MSGKYNGMLAILNKIPDRFFDIDATDLYQILKGPTLIHIPGRHSEPIFISILLHGHEITGLLTIQRFLKKHEGKELPRALSLFIGNVEAARYRRRLLEGQPDYNRIWQEGTHPENGMAHQIFDEMRRRKVFISLDIHNTTGMNPDYASINRLDRRFFKLARLFSKGVVYFTTPTGVQSNLFAELCPSVTLECGKPGHPQGIDCLEEFLDRCFHLTKIVQHPHLPSDMELFHVLVRVMVPAHLSLGFEKDETDIRLVNDLDKMNFKKIPPETLLGWTRPRSGAHLLVLDELDQDVGEHYLSYERNEIRTKSSMMPSMLTLEKEIIRQDCLGYFMERISPEEY